MNAGVERHMGFVPGFLEARKKNSFDRVPFSLLLSFGPARRSKYFEQAGQTKESKIDL